MADFRSPLALLSKFMVMSVLIVFSYLALLFACLDIKSDSYLAAYLDKKKLVIETQSPKMVFIGGSNLAFGLDSARISQAFGLPVVNMGLHGGLGLKFMLDQVKPYLKKNDVVVVIPEYEHFVGDFFYGDKDLIEVVRLTHNWLPLLEMPAIQLGNNVLKLNSCIFKYSLDGSRLTTDPIYARNSFNSYGDVTAHLLLPNEKFSRNYKAIANDINQTSIKYLRNFIVTNGEHGITTFMLYPSLEMSNYQRQVPIITKIEKALRLKGIMASSPQDFLYDDNLFFDTGYHLNRKGRQMNTENIIRIIKASLMGSAPH